MTAAYTILHPTDFSPCAEKAFRVACSMARCRGASLIVLNVLEPVRASATWTGAEFVSPAKVERWETLGQLRTREPEVCIETLVRKGNPAEEILALASELPCDLIVMGMQGHTQNDAWGFGGVTAEVTRRARCPVLAVNLPRR